MIIIDHPVISRLVRNGIHFISMSLNTLTNPLILIIELRVKRRGSAWRLYSDVIIDAMVSKITSLTDVYSTVYSKKTSKLHVTRLCAGNSPVPVEFPAQMASNAKNVSIWWRHHGTKCRSYSQCRNFFDNMCRKILKHVLVFYKTNGWIC